MNAAASSWGVPQPTLKRICDGSTTNPRAGALARIAETHGTTVEWLLNGTGPDPLRTVTAPRAAFPEATEWQELVGSLGLRERDYWQTLLLPGEIYDAMEYLLEQLPQPPASLEKRNRIGSAWTDAERLSYRAWSTALGALAEVWGKPAIRAVLEKDPLLLRAGFRETTRALLRSAAARTELTRQVAEEEKNNASLFTAARAAAKLAHKPQE